jgi:serine/threonine-protein kinase
MPAEIISLARTSAQTAVQLDDRLADAHVALGSVSYYLDFEPRAAEAAYLRALELNPNNIDLLLHVSWFYAQSGHHNKALAANSRAVELDPLSMGALISLGQVYHLNRDFDEAIRVFEQALELGRNDPSAHYYLAWPLEQQGQFKRTITLYQSAIELSKRAPLYLSALGHAYGLAGMHEEAIQILEELERAAHPSPYNLAVVHLGLGQYEQAIDWLEKAYEARNSHLVYINRGAKFDPLRDNERFIGLLERIAW